MIRFSFAFRWWLATKIYVVKYVGLFYRKETLFISFLRDRGDNWQTVNGLFFLLAWKLYFSLGSDKISMISNFGVTSFKCTLCFTSWLFLGYDWLGWKKKINSETLNLMFTFDTVRTFHRVDIHTNNHFSKDIQIFRRAKIYFSNEVKR